MQRVIDNLDPVVAQKPPTISGDLDSPISPLSVRISIAVKITGIGRSKIYELIQEGAIDVVKIGSATLIPIASLHRLLENNRRR